MRREDVLLLEQSECVQRLRIPDEQEERLALLRVGATMHGCIRWLGYMRMLLVGIGLASCGSGLLLGMIRTRHPPRDAYGGIVFSKNKEWILGTPLLFLGGIACFCLQQIIKGSALRWSLKLYRNRVLQKREAETIRAPAKSIKLTCTHFKGWVSNSAADRALILQEVYV